MYKSRSHVQITSPTWDEPYDGVQDRNRWDVVHLVLLVCSASGIFARALYRDDDADIPLYYRLITLYQMVHDELHAKSGQIQGPLKLQCIRNEKEVVMGWVRFSASFFKMVSTAPSPDLFSGRSLSHSSFC
jgi:hypothetical protein